MENKRKEYTAGMENKVAEMITALVAVQGKFEELENVKGSGAEAAAELQAKKALLKEEMQLATDLSTAKYLMQQIEDFEKDIELQSAINNGQATKFVGELDELFKTFFAVHAGAKTIFNVLDKEYIETMSIRSLDEDTATMDGFASKINGCFSTAKALLIDAGLAQRNTVIFAQTHLGQQGVLSKGGALKRSMAKVQRELSI